MTFGPANSQSAYLPIEFDFPQDEKLARELISKRERLTASIINNKENANYEKTEVLTGQQWFSTTNTATTTGSSRINRYGYRYVFDLVDLNNGPIPVGTTVITLTFKIIGIKIPLPSKGSATIAGPQYIFGPGSLLDFKFDNTSMTQQKISVINNSGSALIQCYFDFEYLKQ